MSAFEDHKEEIEHYEQMLGDHCGRLAVTLDRVTNAMVLVGQHGVYCHSLRNRRQADHGHSNHYRRTAQSQGTDSERNGKSARGAGEPFTYELASRRKRINTEVTEAQSGTENSAESFTSLPEMDSTRAPRQSLSRDRAPETRSYRRAAPVAFPFKEWMIVSNEPPHRSVRPMLPANNVSPANSLPGSRSIDFAARPAARSSRDIARHIETNAALCMPRRMQHVRLKTPPPDGIAITQQFVDFDLIGSRNPQPGRLHIERTVKFEIVWMDAHRRAGRFTQPAQSPDMIDVRMCDENCGHPQLVAMDDAQNLLGVGTRIDDYGFERFRIANDVAIALQHSDGKNLVDDAWPFLASDSI